MTRAARPLLCPLVPLYRLGLALREFELRSGLKTVRRLGWPVISVGNLSAGGSGKTPLAIALAKALTARGAQVDVLSRGYGRHSKVAARVDPKGSVADFGDEPLVIAREAGVPVYVAAERYEAGLMAEGASQSAAAGESASRPVGVHLLDDGFQHRQLARDVDILLLGCADLNDHLLPTGNLREPLDAGERAHVIAIPADDADTEAEIKSRGWRAEVWRLRRRMEIPRVEGPVGAFCGIAWPQQFFDGLERAGVKIAMRTAFSDHYNYSRADLDRLASQARAAGATTLLTTEKDRVRLDALAAALPIQTVPLHIEIEDKEPAIDWLMARVKDRT